MFKFRLFHTFSIPYVNPVSDCDAAETMRYITIEKITI